MISTIKYKLDQFRHFPFDINFKSINFYCYYHGCFKPEFTNYTNDEFYGQDRKLRITLSIVGYTFDFNIRDK